MKRKLVSNLSLVLAFMLVFSLVGVGPSYASSPVVSIPDAGLKAAIKAELGLKTNSITKAHMEKLVNLGAFDRNIVDLTGLEHAIYLERLLLQRNSISLLGPLKGLTNLKYLDLSENQINSIINLRGLSNLEELHLYRNNISDVSPLSGMTKMEVLEISNNRISDISSLSRMKDLNYLTMDYNSIIKIDVVKNFPKLRGLVANNNRITDIDMLKDLKELSEIQLRNCYVSDLTQIRDMPGLNSIYIDRNILPLTTRNNNNFNYLRSRGIMVHTEQQYSHSQISSNWIKDSGNFYYYQNGNRLTGWRDIGGRRYFFDSSGVMRTGWIKISGVYYYMAPSGALLVSNGAGEGDNIGRVNAENGVNLRRAPGGDVISVIPHNRYVEVISIARSDKGELWYEVATGGLRGYIHKNYVDIIISGSKLEEPYLTDKITVLSGQDRYLTAVEVSKASYNSSPRVILASGQNYPDALAGGVLASQLDAPILLTQSDGFPRGVLEEIDRLGSEEVIILGGENTINQSLEGQLEERGLHVTRIAGEERYETAGYIAGEIGDGHSGEVFLVSGQGYADALSIGSVAARDQQPILLTEGSDLHESTILALEELGVEQVTLVGGEAVLSPAIEDQLAELGIGASRLAGSDRYETSLLVAKSYYGQIDTAIIASGQAYPDALVGAYLGALRSAPIILASKSKITSSSLDYLQANKPQAIMLGGPSALGKPVERDLSLAIH